MYFDVEILNNESDCPSVEPKYTTVPKQVKENFEVEIEVVLVHGPVPPSPRLPDMYITGITLCKSK